GCWHRATVVPYGAYNPNGTGFGAAASVLIKSTGALVSGINVDCTISGNDSTPRCRIGTLRELIQDIDAARPGCVRGSHCPATNRHRSEAADPHEEGWLGLGYTGFHIAGFTCKRALPRRVYLNHCPVVSVGEPIGRGIVLTGGLPTATIEERRGARDGAGVSRFLHLLLLIAQISDIDTQAGHQHQHNQCQGGQHQSLSFVGPAESLQILFLCWNSLRHVSTSAYANALIPAVCQR